MLYLKISGSILTLVGAYLLSKNLNKKAESALCETEGFLALIRHISLEIDSFLMPMPEILRRVDKDILRKCGYRVDMAPSSLYELYEAVRFKSEKCRLLVYDLSRDVGSGQKDEELKRLSYYGTLLEEEWRRLAAELPAKRKVNTTLAVSAALGIIILMI